MGLHHNGKALPRFLLTLLFVTNVYTAREQSPLKKVALTFLLVTPSPLPAFSGAVPSKAPLEPLNTLYQILDSMVKVMEGPRSQVPLNQFLKIRNSIYKLDPGLATSQEKGWAGMLVYYKTGGGQGDAWGSKPSQFEERNVTFFPVGQTGLLVYEPCNYASNIAYYQMAVGLASPNHRWSLKAEEVRGLGQASAALALGSAFWHGSHTRLGQVADSNLISVMAFIMHQASLSGLPTSSLTPELFDLSSTKRAKTGVQIAQVVTDMYSFQPVGEWRSTLASLDLPRYEVTFSAIVTTLITLLLPTSIAEPLIRTLTGIFGISELGPFIIDTYLPKLRRAFSRTRLPIFTKLKLLKNTLSTVYKLVYAFLFQEQTIDIDMDMAEMMKGMKMPAGGEDDGEGDSDDEELPDLE